MGMLRNRPKIPTRDTNSSIDRTYSSMNRTNPLPTEPHYKVSIASSTRERIENILKSNNRKVGTYKETIQNTTNYIKVGASWKYVLMIILIIIFSLLL